MHAYRDGRLEEVVLRHLGAEDGHTVIAKNIRFCLLPCILPSFHLLATTFVVISFLFVSLSRFDTYFQALGLPQKFAHKVNACFELPGRSSIAGHRKTFTGHRRLLPSSSLVFASHTLAIATSLSSSLVLATSLSSLVFASRTQAIATSLSSSLVFA
ncbi:hypothetical protein HYC85_022588 [Camellia sinensis]|uniref:Uncharacterized protein n=1 Tax=Camellia sinensis TaxID=4442 RepID=A0A7J7GC39_CAMSI|nr:hypothetical protein HYC85_022588 [Camellia sinensis]